MSYLIFRGFNYLIIACSTNVRR